MKIETHGQPRPGREDCIKTSARCFLQVPNLIAQTRGPKRSFRRFRTNSTAMNDTTAADENSRKFPPRLHSTLRDSSSQARFRVHARRLVLLIKQGYVEQARKKTILALGCTRYYAASCEKSATLHSTYPGGASDLVCPEPSMPIQRSNCNQSTTATTLNRGRGRGSISCARETS